MPRELSREPRSTPRAPATLARRLGLGGAIRLNMLDMIGVGPFITLPLMLRLESPAVALLAWGLGALLALCDGMIWSELGASLPQAGGSYQYLKTIYGERRWGRMFSFLFAWQVLFSAPLSIASGAIGLAHYAGYLWPSLHQVWFAWTWGAASGLRIGPGTVVAMGVCLLATYLLARDLGHIERLAYWLWAGVMLALAWIIVAGLLHFNLRHVLSASPPATATGAWSGLAAAMLIATYDYWGYYNICFLGGELKDAPRTLPRAVLGSIGLVAVLYILMNLGILAVIPPAWFHAAGHVQTRNAVAAVFMSRLYGPWGGRIAALLIIWTAFGSLFSLLLGYSRVPWAAARDGNFFSGFGRLDAGGRFPRPTLLFLGFAGALACTLTLYQVIAALVVVRLVLQFLLQAVGLLWLRRRQRAIERPFRMWLYPLPALAAIAGFLYMLLGRPQFGRELAVAGLLLGFGLAFFLLRARRSATWPFAVSTQPAGEEF